MNQEEEEEKTNDNNNSNILNYIIISIPHSFVIIYLFISHRHHVIIHPPIYPNPESKYDFPEIIIFLSLIIVCNCGRNFKNSVLVLCIVR